MTDPVLVLGMHRSGTSFMIRALNLSGLWLGAETELSTVEGRAMIGNPKGNYENREAININDFILKKSGGAWYNPPRQLSSDEADAQRIRTFCAALEQGRPAEFQRWGWKDPRTLLTLNVWLRALQKRVFIVASFRHPTAVAQSLLARDKIPMEVGYALWIHYNTLLLAYMEAFPHILVRFDVEKKHLIDQVVRVCEVTGLRRDPHLIESWHDVDLVRSNAPNEELPSNAQIAGLWRKLMGAHRLHSPRDG